MSKNSVAEPSQQQANESALRRRLGDILISHGVIEAKALDQAIREQQELLSADPTLRRLRLGALLVERGLVDEHQVADALAELLDKQVVDPRTVEIDLGYARLIPRAVAERGRLLILGNDDGVIRLVAADPSDVVALDDVRRATGLSRLEIAVGTPSVVQELIQRVWALNDSAPVSELIEEPEAALTDDDLAVLDAPTVRLADSILADAARSRASDVHIEPQATNVRIRYRVDGLLRDAMTLPKAVGRPLVSRLKIVAGMDIAERRVPQDGRLRLHIDGVHVDARASSLPSLYGEKLVIRLLPGSASLQPLGALGLDEEQRTAVVRALASSQGLVLITGPTGSGKTNTLYAGIKEATTPERNVVTLEDPIEIELPGITQVPVDERTGMTFTRGLRAILRQDPDVILVGEVRDPETAELTLRAALTGHVVLTTLHTNDALSALPRLVDMGVPSYLVASALSVIVAQRLVRKNCPSCTEPYVPGEATQLALAIDETELTETAARGAGCTRCSSTGFLGRVGVFEVLVITPELRRALLTEMPADDLAALAYRQGFRSLRSQALGLAHDGTTTYEEVVRVTRADG